MEEHIAAIKNRGHFLIDHPKTGMPYL